MENEGEEKSGEKGKENAGTKEEEEGKAAGKRGNGTGKVGATRLKTRTRGTESPRTEIGRTVKNSRKKESLERKTHKENIGHVSGAVHKGKIKGKGKGRKKGGRTGARKGGYYWTEDAHKESMEDALEQRNELERKNGGGGKDCKKEKTQEQRTHTGKARKMHKKPHMKTQHIY